MRPTRCASSPPAEPARGGGIGHIRYGIGAGIRLRHRLAEISRQCRTPQRTVAVDPAELRRRGFTVLVLDFDGVLAPHGQDRPLPEIEDWLRRCAGVMGEERIFILSNRPDPARAAYFRGAFPGVRFVTGVRKKPYPDGLQRIAELSGEEPARLVLLDDRLLTGVLATCLAGTGVVYITAPYVAFRAHPAAEGFFALIRILERWYIAALTLPG